MNYILNYLKDALSDAIYLIPAILIALSLHEWAHAYAAYRLGDPTARNLGRMTINPLRHIDPVGFIMLLLVRFGWAKPVPINPRNFTKPRRDEIIVSLAGVVTNLLSAFLSMGLYYLLIVSFHVTNDVVLNFVAMFYSINLGLCIFNLIPIPPLDGYHVVECLLIRKIGPKPFMFLERYGSLILILLVFSNVLTSLMSTVTSTITGGIMSFYNTLFSLF